MYSVFTKLVDGGYLFIASRDELGQATELSEQLNIHWPHDYVVRDSMGNDVEPERESAVYYERRTA